MCAISPKSTLAFAIALALGVTHSTGVARPLNGESETLNNGAPIENWTLTNGAALTVNGATTRAIDASSGSTVNLNASSLVQSTGTNAVTLNQSIGNFSGARLESTGAYGLQLTTNLDGATGTLANVADSTIIGRERGVSVAVGELNLSNTIVQGNDDGDTGFLFGGIGMGLFNGNVTITNHSQITGAQNGILVSPDEALASQLSTVLIDNSSVTGTKGSAIIVGSFDDAIPSSANITIQNGSTLTGGNGVILEVANNSSAIIKVDDSRLTGDVLVGDGSSAALTLQNNAGLVGNITNVANITLNANASTTGNITRADTLNVVNGSSINGNVTDVTNLAVSGNSSTTGTISRVNTLTVDNGSRINGDVSDVANLSVSGNSSTTGTIARVDTLSALNGSRINGDVSDVANLTVSGNSSTTGNITNVDTFIADNASSISGVISNVQNFNLSGGSQVSGNLNGITNLSLDNSTWTTNDGQGVTNLSMNAGTVKLGSADGTFETLNVSTLSGSGRFIMDTDLAAHQSDLVNVSGQATGNYELQIKNTGVDPIKGDQDQQVVHTGAGSTAGFAVVGGQVDFGTFAYDLEQRGTDWFLVQKFDDDGKPIVTPGTESVIGLFSAAPTVWYGELSTLRSRMGELRYGETQGGAWTRAYGNKYNMSAAGGTAYQQNQHGVSFGADAPLPVSDGQWLVGVLAGYSRSDLDIAAGTSGHVDSYYLGAYTTWLSDSGYYVDAVLKANRFKNEADVRMSDGTKTDGNYNTVGIGASVEAGKHIKLQDNWFVEPFGQISTLWVKGEDYSLDNGMDASSNKADSFLGKVGTTVGRNFPLDKGGYVQPYAKVALAHEFAKSNRVKVNDNTFSNDLSGSRGEVGAGIAAQLTDVLQLHADVDYSNGKNIEQPWGVNVGVRYSW